MSGFLSVLSAAPGDISWLALLILYVGTPGPRLQHGAPRMCGRACHQMVEQPGTKPCSLVSHESECGPEHRVLFGLSVEHAAGLPGSSAAWGEAGVGAGGRTGLWGWRGSRCSRLRGGL